MGNDELDMARIILRRLYTEYKTGGAGLNVGTLRQATGSMLVGFTDVMDFLFYNGYIQLNSKTNLYSLTQLGMNEAESEGRR